MKPVARVVEPPEFATTRERGNTWLTRNLTSPDRPPAYWRDFSMDLGRGFHYLCGYMALWTTDGTVDHFVSVDEDRSRAYEWDNYRYVAGWVNSSKQNVVSTDLLDPYEIEDGWFEILLPTLELVLTSKVPPDKRARAERTLARLPIGRDGRAIKRRAVYYEEYQKREIGLDEIRRRAPLLAAAIEKAQTAVPAGAVTR
jgi:hypothetical protein